MILDYGHNAAAMKAMADLAQRLDVSGRRIAVISAPGDRRDEDIAEIARQAATAFDHLILRRDDDPRGRDLDTVPHLMATTLRDDGVAADRFQIVIDEPAAIDTALAMGRPGDLIIIFGDNLTRSWKQIIYFNAGEGAADLLAPGGAGEASPLQAPPHAGEGELAVAGLALIADERGVRLARETDD